MSILRTGEIDQLAAFINNRLVEKGVLDAGTALVPSIAVAIADWCELKEKAQWKQWWVTIESPIGNFEERCTMATDKEEACANVRNLIGTSWRVVAARDLP